jgi:hypothetical protein
LAKINNNYIFSVETETENWEPDLRKALEDVQCEFNNIHFNLGTGKKRLIPVEGLIEITMVVGGTVAAEVTLRILERLWQRLKEHGLGMKTEVIDAVQSFAEEYLESIGVREYVLLRRTNKGPYVKFKYRDKKKYVHIVDVAAIKLQILNYEKKGE